LIIDSEENGGNGRIMLIGDGIYHHGFTEVNDIF
jgi:hypothetical protein